MFLTIDTWRALLGRGALDAALARLYGAQALPRQRARHLMLLDRFAARFGPAREAAILSAPGRTELCGNHTDHQGGRVLAAAVTADCLAVVSPSGAPGRAALASEGYAPLTLSLEQLAPAAGERGTTAALLRGAGVTLALFALVFAQLIHVFECKSEERSLFTINPFNNIKLLLAVLLSTAIVLIAVFFPPAQLIFRTAALTGGQVLTIVGYLMVAPILAALLGALFRPKRK